MNLPIKLYGMFFLFLILILAGCSAIQQKPIALKELRSGTKGLTFSFVNGNPPAQVYESKPSSDEGIFPVTFIIKNEGAGDITYGLLTLSFEDEYLSIVPRSWQWNEKGLSVDNNVLLFKLKGKSLNNPFGEQGTASLFMRTKLLDSQSESRKSVITATACYDYQTQATVPICIDTDPYSFNKGVKSCKVSDVSLSSQGAPLAVTKVEEKAIPKGANRVGLEFLITVKNRGSGEVISLTDPLNPERNPDTFSYDNLVRACRSKLFSEEVDTARRQRFIRNFWNVVSAKLVLGNDVDDNFDCTPVPLRLSDKQGVLRCVYKGTLPAAVNYMTVLNIKLDYGYTESKTKEIEVLKTYNPKNQ